MLDQFQTCLVNLKFIFYFFAKFLFHLVPNPAPIGFLRPRIMLVTSPDGPTYIPQKPSKDSKASRPSPRTRPAQHIPTILPQEPLPQGSSLIPRTLPVPPPPLSRTPQNLAPGLQDHLPSPKRVGFFHDGRAKFNNYASLAGHTS